MPLPSTANSIASALPLANANANATTTTTATATATNFATTMSATILTKDTFTNVKDNIRVTGQWLAAVGEDDWWRHLLIFIRTLIFLTAYLLSCGFCVLGGYLQV
jgi:hypothetical protein